MEYFIGGFIGFSGFIILLRSIFSIKNSQNISKFMKDILVFILVGVLLISISVSAHYFYSSNTPEKAKLNLGVILVVQVVMIGFGGSVIWFSKK